MLLYTLCVPKTKSHTTITLPTVDAQPATQNQVDAVGLIIHGGWSDNFEGAFNVFSDKRPYKEKLADRGAQLLISKGNAMVKGPSTKQNIDFDDINWLGNATFKNEDDVDHNFNSLPFSISAGGLHMDRPSDVSQPFIAGSVAMCNATPQDAFADFNNNNIRIRVKRGDIEFFYFTQTKSTSISTPPAGVLESAEVHDIFVHRIVPDPTSTAGRRVQLWISILKNDQLVWEVASVGRIAIIKGSQRYLGVDISSGKPFWYTHSTYSKFVQKERKRRDP